jgi:hypothetical protein
MAACQRPLRQCLDVSALSSSELFAATDRTLEVCPIQSYHGGGEMARTDVAHITGSVLGWAIKRAGVTRETLVWVPEILAREFRKFWHGLP